MKEKPNNKKNGQDSGTAPKPDAAQPDSNPFAPENLRLTQDFAASAGVEKHLITVPVRKPDRQWFFRVHPDAAYQLSAAILELREEREIYLIGRDLWSALVGEFVPMQLYTAINRQGVVFIWPVRLPGEDGREMEWHRTARVAAGTATKRWIRMCANMSLGAYELSTASADLDDPEWPDKTMEDLLTIAFRDKLIKDVDHPVLRRLRGEM